MRGELDNGIYGSFVPVGEQVNNILVCSPHKRKPSESVRFRPWRPKGSARPDFIRSGSPKTSSSPSAQTAAQTFYQGEVCVSTSTRAATSLPLCEEI